MSSGSQSLKEALGHTSESIPESTVKEILNGLMSEVERIEDRLSELVDVLKPVLVPASTDVEPLTDLYNARSDLGHTLSSTVTRLANIRRALETLITRVDL